MIIGPNFVFIQVGKSASKSIEASLLPYDRDRSIFVHVVYADAVKRYPNIKNKFKFIFIRNPWARMVSFYYYSREEHLSPKSSGALKRTTAYQNRIFAKPFKQWLMETEFWVRDYGIDYLSPVQQRSQLTWGKDNSGKMVMDYVGKVEEMESSLEYLRDKINMPMPYHHKNKCKHPQYHKNYKNFYDEKSKAWISKYFEEDIDYGKYIF